MCRDKEFPTVPNKQIDREVKDLIITCTNKKDGCSWKGEIRSIERHRKTCPLEEVDCEYASVGCKTKVPRKDLKTHNKVKMESHLALSTVKLKNLEHLLYVTTMSNICDFDEWPLMLEPIAMMATSGDKTCPVIFKMPAFAAKRAAEEVWFSEPFFTHKKGYKMCLCVDATGFTVSSSASSDDDDDDPEMSVSLYLKKGPYDDKLKWPLNGDFEIKLLNQLKDSCHHQQSIECDDDSPTAALFRVIDAEMASTGLGGQFISYSEFDNSDDEDPVWLYLKDDCLFFQVSFELSD